MRGQTLGDEDTNSEGSVTESQSAGHDKIEGRMVDQESASWVNLFKDNRKLDEGFKLQPFLDDVEESWGYCLLGYFAGRFLDKTTLL